MDVVKSLNPFYLETLEDVIFWVFFDLSVVILRLPFVEFLVAFCLCAKGLGIL